MKKNIKGGESLVRALGDELMIEGYVVDEKGRAHYEYTFWVDLDDTKFMEHINPNTFLPECRFCAKHTKSRRDLDGHTWTTKTFYWPVSDEQIRKYRNHANVKTEQQEPKKGSPSIFPTEPALLAKLCREDEDSRYVVYTHDNIAAQLHSKFDSVTPTYDFTQVNMAHTCSTTPSTSTNMRVVSTCVQQDLF